MNYLVRMTPCEAYSFGADESFQFAGTTRVGKETYFVRSKDMPEQTTILGMLRYMILEGEGLLRSDFQYTKEDKKQMEACIGPESFQFSSKKKQNFGFIQNISPVFLINKKGDYYIKNPFHNKGEKGYSPMQLSMNPVETSEGIINLPDQENYNAKKGYASGYYNLSDGSVEKGLFRSEFISGNRKNGKEGTDEDCFFKREVKRLQKDFSMAVFIEAERFPDNSFACMGLKKALFQVTAEKVVENDLIQRLSYCYH